jgi:Rieske 2Fe-2S protein
VSAAGGGALCPLADLPDGVPRGLTAATGDGPLDLVLMRRSGRLIAYRNRCPHRGTPLDWRPTASWRPTACISSARPTAPAFASPTATASPAPATANGSRPSPSLSRTG